MRLLLFKSLSFEIWGNAIDMVDWLLSSAFELSVGDTE